MKRIVLAGLMIFGAVSLSSAAPGALEGKWWKRPRIARELGLSDEQVQRIEKIFLKSRPVLIDLKAELEKRQVERDAVLDQNTVDTREASRRIDAVADARAKLEKSRSMMMLEIRQVLSPEQRQKILELMEGMRDRVMDRPNRARPKESPEE